MLKFYRKAAAILIGLIAFTLAAGYICVSRAFLHSELLPAEKSALRWRAKAVSDSLEGGSSSISINDARFSLDFSFIKTGDFEYPYISFSLVFENAAGAEKPVDLSRYTSLSFSARCAPRNQLLLTVDTIDKDITRPGDFSTYRIPTAYFSCEENWTNVEIDLAHLQVPDWWLRKLGLQLSEQDYQLNESARLTFGSTLQSPLGVASNVKIDELILRGRDWRYLYALLVLMSLAWGGFAIWFFRQYTVALILDVREKLQKDRPLVAYQQLSIETKKDKEKSAILRYMATEYANPDLNLDMLVAKLGSSRAKVNDILKEELGYTFTAYLNKLRLTEAARLLSEKDAANVAEIAYSVGYRNVPYFNKLFKMEYGCAPKTFRDIRDLNP